MNVKHGIYHPGFQVLLGLVKDGIFSPELPIIRLGLAAPSTM